MFCYHSTRMGASIQDSLTHSQPQGKRSRTISYVWRSTRSSPRQRLRPRLQSRFASFAQRAPDEWGAFIRRLDATFPRLFQLLLHLRGAAVGLFSLLRTEGGSVGTSMANTIQEPRQQFHLSRLGENLGPLNPHVQSFLEQTREFFLGWTGDPARSQQLAVQSLDGLRQQQAASMAFFDVFWVCAVLSGALVVLVLLMKRSVAEKGEHVSAH